MELSVSRVIKGEHPGLTLRVEGDRGGSCRPYVNRFPIGSQWVFALSVAPNPKPCVSWLSNCGEYWLRLEKGSVFGRIGNGRTEMTLDQLEAELRVIR